MATGEQETVVIRHWRAVNEEGLGIAYSMSEREDPIARVLVSSFCRQHPQYHLEEWVQTFQVSPSTWERVS